MFTSSSIREQLIIPLWVYKNKSLRLSYMKKLEKSQYESVSSIRERQFNIIKEVIKNAYEHTAYYKNKLNEYGMSPEKISDYAEFHKLPLLTKRDLQDRRDELISDNICRQTLIPFKTGGSTGKSVTVYWDRDSMEKGIGSSLRSFKWTGWKLGEPCGRVWGNPPLCKTIKERMINWLISPQIFLDTMTMTESSMYQFTEKWKKIKPTLLHGHSHSLYLFALYCRKSGNNIIRPKAIISTSMMLVMSERKMIEDVFQCKVTDLYGCEEVGLIASECEEHLGMHINSENVYVEIINNMGDHVRSGEEGAIVVTSLINNAMPLIRYKIEDVGIISEKSCPCGRNLPILEKVTGRVADYLIRKDGGMVAGVSLVERTLTAIPGIYQMQIIQEDIDTICLNIVKSEIFNESTAMRLIEEIQAAMGNVNVCFKYAESIAPEKSGKYRFSISKVVNPYL